MLINRSIICFGGEDWWYHHPHSKAHLMRKFARAGNKVIFVNSISMGLPGLAHKDLLPRIKRKLGSYSKLARQDRKSTRLNSSHSQISYAVFCLKKKKKKKNKNKHNKTNK